MILLVSRNTRRACEYSEIFHYMGILSSVATPTEALSELSLLYRAVLVIDPDTIVNHEDLVRRLKSYASIPIFAIGDCVWSDRDKVIFSGCFKSDTGSGTVAAQIARYCKDTNQSALGDYRLLAFDATPDLSVPRFRGETLPLTRTEAMILRYLIRTYPNPQTCEKILRYAYRPSRRPEPSGIRTHICLMNRKFKAIAGRNLITSIPDRGYVLLTHETKKKEALV